MALFPGATISSNRVVVAASAAQAITGFSSGVGVVTVNPAINTYNVGAAATETVPALATRVQIEVVGPGGIGGTGNLAAPGGGGGGGGAYVSARMDVIAGQTFTFTVGTASGTASTVVNGTAAFISLSAGSGTDGATSAAGGAAGTAGVATSSIGTSRGATTSGTAGTAGAAGNGGAGGAGATPLGGAGAASPGTGAGTAGTAPGGGGSGSGSASAAAGGAGAAGRIIFTYFVDKLALDTNAVAGSTFNNGFAVSSTGALFGTVAVAGTDDFQAGVRRSATGAVVFVVGAPTQFGNGNPQDANGALACI